jgi:uncharacterized membrane protein YfcA
MSAKLLDLFPAGGDDFALKGPFLIAGIVGTFLLGALMTLGIGAYAPIMMMVSLLGMNPKAAFPIMMGSCAFLTCAGSLRFVSANKYDATAALGLTLGGIPAVLCAAYLIKELPLEIVRALVVIIVIYTGVTLLVAARRQHQSIAMIPSVARSNSVS